MIRILRLTNAQRVALGGLDAGRFCWCTDTSALYLGTAAGDKKIDLETQAEFIDLSDTPAAWAGQSNKNIMVNATSDALVFKGSPLTVGCKVYLSANQLNIGGAGDVLVLFDTVEYDIGGDFDVGTSLFTTRVAGYYYMGLNLYCGGIADQNRVYAKIKYDGNLIANEANNASGTNNFSVSTHCIFYCAATKTIGGYFSSNNAANDVLGGGAYNSTSMDIHLLSEA